VLRRLAALPAREEALELAAEPGLELVFFPRALPVSETPGNEQEIIRMVSDIWGNLPQRTLPKLIYAGATALVSHSLYIFKARQGL